VTKEKTDHHRRAADIRAAHESALAVAEYLKPDGKPVKPPRKATRLKMASYLRAEATIMRGQAEKGRDDAKAMTAEAAAVTIRFAVQQEARAKMFEEFADWVGTL
jgi:hypothetical protein